MAGLVVIFASLLWGICSAGDPDAMEELLVDDECDVSHGGGEGCSFSALQYRASHQSAAAAGATGDCSRGVNSWGDCAAMSSDCASLGKHHVVAERAVYDLHWNCTYLCRTTPGCNLYNYNEADNVCDLRKCSDPKDPKLQEVEGWTWEHDFQPCAPHENGCAAMSSDCKTLSSARRDTAVDCIETCFSMSGCSGFNQDEKEGLCIFKHCANPAAVVLTPKMESTWYNVSLASCKEYRMKGCAASDCQALRRVTVDEDACMTECSSSPGCNGVNYNSGKSICDVLKCANPMEPTFSYVPDVMYKYNYVPPTDMYDYHSSYGR